MKVIRNYLPESKFYQRGKHKIKRIVVHSLDHERTDEWLLAYEQRAPNFYDEIIGTYGDVYLRNPNPAEYASRNVAHNNYWSYGICINMPTTKAGIKNFDRWDYAQAGVGSMKSNYAIPHKEQIIALADRIEALADAHGLLINVCTVEQHLDITRRYAKQTTLAPYTVLGHYHHQTNRLDPGPITMALLAKELRRRDKERSEVAHGTLATPESYPENVKIVKSRSEAKRIKWLRICHGMLRHVRSCRGGSNE